LGDESIAKAIDTARRRSPCIVIDGRWFARGMSEFKRLQQPNECGYV
jgi:hypothetical protein